METKLINVWSAHRPDMVRELATPYESTLHNILFNGQTCMLDAAFSGQISDLVRKGAIHT
jgi:hypothetical protein